MTAVSSMMRTARRGRCLDGKEVPLAEIGANAWPRLKSGLKPQRCSSWDKNLACKPPQPRNGQLQRRMSGERPSPLRKQSRKRTRRDALLNLAQQVICPLGLTVRNARTKPATEINPEDYEAISLLQHDGRRVPSGFRARWRVSPLIRVPLRQANIRVGNLSRYAGPSSFSFFIPP